MRERESENEKIGGVEGVRKIRASERAVERGRLCRESHESDRGEERAGRQR